MPLRCWADDDVDRDGADMDEFAGRYLEPSLSRAVNIL